MDFSYLYTLLLNMQFKWICWMSFWVFKSNAFVYLTFFFTTETLLFSFSKFSANTPGTSKNFKKSPECSVQISSTISRALFSCSMSYSCFSIMASWSADLSFRIWMRQGAGSKFGLRNQASLDRNYFISMCKSISSSFILSIAIF